MQPVRTDTERCELWAAEWRQIAANAETQESRERFSDLARRRERLAEVYGFRDELLLTDWLR